MKSRFLNVALDKDETIEFEGFNPDLSMSLWIKLEQLNILRLSKRDSISSDTRGCTDMSTDMSLPLLIALSLFVGIGDACGPYTGLNQNRNLFRGRGKTKITIPEQTRTSISRT